MRFLSTSSRPFLLVTVRPPSPYSRPDDAPSIEALTAQYTLTPIKFKNSRFDTQKVLIQTKRTIETFALSLGNERYTAPKNKHEHFKLYKKSPLKYLVGEAAALSHYCDSENCRVCVQLPAA